MNEQDRKTATEITDQVLGDLNRNSNHYRRELLQRKVIEALTTAREEQQEKDCKALCSDCFHDVPMLFDGSVLHKQPNGSALMCAAAAIRGEDKQ